jgi:large subunit ribosomal protein L28
MSRKCFVCGKGPMVTLAVTRTGSKLRSGKKRYITGKSKRRQLPNLHKVKLDINGTVKRVRVCTSCLTSSKVKKIV